jgi:thiol-disulfide isomerase/thioredoxin
MNKTYNYLLPLLLVLASCKTMQQKNGNTNSTTIADKNIVYETKVSNSTSYLFGSINETVLTTDTLCKTWFVENKKYGLANPETIAIFTNKKNNFELLVFGGTWCEDTHNLLPKLYRVAEESGYDKNKITVIAVDINKKAPSNLHTLYSITNVPTFIVLQNKKEIGRVVEYGKTGDAIKELAAIIEKL